MTVKLFQEHTQEEHANALAAYYPDNPLFAGKYRPTAKLRELLLGLAEQLRIAENQIELIWEQLDITETVDLIEEWEKALGIPDTCFFGERTIEIRRRDILVKLNSSVQTAQDFEDLAALLGVEVRVISGAESSIFPITFPMIFADGTSVEQRFTMVVIVIDVPPVSFPLEFPILFPETAVTVVQCLFRLLKPANVEVIFQQAL